MHSVSPVLFQLALLSLNSSDVMSMDEMISNELQITPHLLALESFTNTTPASLNSASLASGVVNKLALAVTGAIAVAAAVATTTTTTSTKGPTT